MSPEDKNALDTAAALSAAIDSIAASNPVVVSTSSATSPAIAPQPVATPAPVAAAPVAVAPVAAAPQPVAAAETRAPVVAKSKPKTGLGPRWSYILTRGTVVASIWAFFTYAFDPLVRTGVIWGSQSVVRAKVEIDTFETKFFPPEIYLAKAAAANRNKPGTNLLEFKELHGDVDGFALLKGSYIIDKATLTGVTWETKRADDGLLPGYEPEPVDPNAIDYAAELEKFGKDWAKSILDRAKLEYDPRSLETVRLADELEDKWKDEFDNLEARVKGFEAKVKQIKSTVDGAKKGDTVARIDSYTKLAADAANMLKELDQFRQQLEELPPRAKEDLGDLNAARKRDTEEIRRKVNDLILDGDSLSEFLLGPSLHHRVKQTLAWLQWTNGRVDEFAHPPKPERYRGEDILFPRQFPLPKYLVRLVDFQGEGPIDGEIFKLTGSITNVTSEPKLLEKPTILMMSGFGAEDKVELKAVIDRCGDVPLNQLDASYVLNKPLQFDIGDKDSFSIKVNAQGAKWLANVRTEGNELRGQLLLIQKPAQFEPQIKDNADERLVRMISSSISGINKIEAAVQLGGTIDKPTVKLKTNLGPAIARGVKDAIGNELASEQEALIAKLDAKANEKTSMFIKQFNGRHGDILNQLNINENTVRNLVPKTANLGIEPAKFEDGLKKIFKK